MQWVKKIHKWLSLLVALQLLIWLASGLYFNLMDHKKASGNQYRQRIVAETVDTRYVLEPKQVLAQNPSVVSIKLILLLAKPYYLLTVQQGLYPHFQSERFLVDAISGEKVTVDQNLAITLAQASYSGIGQVKKAIKLSPPYDDIPREHNKVWQINFTDEVNTSVYVDANSGRLVAHSDDDKRFADIFFMLHFMDYAVLGGKAGFNNLQIIIFAIGTVFFALTGLIWTIESLLNGQYKLSFFTQGSKRSKVVALFDKNNQSIAKVKLADHENILDSLITHDIALSSTCGGGGTCGRCKILVANDVKVTSADFHHFNDQELKQGYRLACQHYSDEIAQLTLIEVTQANKQQLRLIQSEFISPTIKELRFKTVDGHKLSFKAGAFMRFFIPAAKGVSIPQRLPDELKPHWHHIKHLEYEHKACSRSYSLANGDGAINEGTDELIFTIKIQSAPHQQVIPGVGSSYICNLELGQTIDAVGPFEEFYAQPASTKIMVLVGAGSGMAPLKALVEEQILLGAINHRKLYFYFGARTETDLIYRDDFHHLSGDYQNFSYIPVLSKPNENWLGVKGYVQQQLSSNTAVWRDVANVEFYLCGPAAMMNQTITMLKAKGVDSKSIFFDAFV